jgi:mitochondrial Rho GTPase 1
LPCSILKTLKFLTRFDVSPDCSVELSPLGYKFLTDVFEVFDKDQDGALNSVELAELFSTSPGNPWIQKETEVESLQMWLAQWR